MQSSANKYKDATPQETIERILSIYKQLGVELSVDISQRQGNIFSATVSDLAGGWNACGKGTSPGFSMASAYAESIEHLCTYFAYDTNLLSDGAIKHGAFHRYPDEQISSLERIKELSPCVFKDMVLAYGVGEQHTDEKEVINTWKKYLNSDTAIFVPFYSIMKKQIVLLPDVVLWTLCGTNGNGAGNTPEEAIGHGLDEICERFSKRQIYTNKLTPPIIHREYIEKNATESFSIIQSIEKSGQYKIVVKDASLGLSLPVLCVLMVDIESQRYLVNFGAHPRFEIALERCLTEMFQSFDPHRHNIRRKGMEKWRKVSEQCAGSIKNWASLLRDDSGIVPDSFFAGTASWRFVKWDDSNYTNKSGMHKRLRHLSSLFGDVFIRNLSFLGFPVFKVYIPTISTNNLFLNELQLSAFESGGKLVRNYRNVSKLSHETLLQLKDTAFSQNSIASSLLFRNHSEGMTNSLLAAVEYELGNTDIAERILREQDDCVCACLLKELELRADGVAIAIRDELLQLFWGAEVFAYVPCWRSDNIVLELLNAIVNKKTNNRASCDALNRLHMQIKAIMLSQMPKQNLTSIFLDCGL